MSLLMEGIISKSNEVISKEEVPKLSFDYKELELKVKEFMKYKNCDVYTQTASELFSVPYTEVTKKMRRIAKGIVSHMLHATCINNVYE